MKASRSKFQVALLALSYLTPLRLNASLAFEKLRLEHRAHLGLGGNLLLTLDREDLRSGPALSLVYTTKPLTAIQLSLKALSFKGKLPVTCSGLGFVEPMEWFFSLRGGGSKAFISQRLAQGLICLSLKGSNHGWKLMLGSTNKVQSVYSIERAIQSMQASEGISPQTPDGSKEPVKDDPQTKTVDGVQSSIESSLESEIIGELASEIIDATETILKAQKYSSMGMAMDAQRPLIRIITYLHTIFQFGTFSFKKAKLEEIVEFTPHYKHLLRFYALNPKFVEKCKALPDSSEFLSYLVRISKSLEETVESPVELVLAQGKKEIKDPFSEGFKFFTAYPEDQGEVSFLMLISLFDQVDFEGSEGKSCFEYVQACFDQGLLSDRTFQYEKIYIPIYKTFGFLSKEGLNEVYRDLKLRINNNLQEAFSSINKELLSRFNDTMLSAEQFCKDFKKHILREKASLQKFKHPQIKARMESQAEHSNFLENRGNAKNLNESSKAYEELNLRYSQGSLGGIFGLCVPSVLQITSSSCSQRELQGTTQSGSATPQLEAEASSIEDESLSFTKLRDKEVDGLYSLPSSPQGALERAKKK